MPDVSLKDARDRRDEARKQVAAGIDPGEHRKAKKTAKVAQQANSFEVVAREWNAKHSPNWSANHGDRIIRRLERDIFPWNRRFAGSRRYRPAIAGSDSPYRTTRSPGNRPPRPGQLWTGLPLCGRHRGGLNAIRPAT